MTYDIIYTSGEDVTIRHAANIDLLKGMMAVSIPIIAHLNKTTGIIHSIDCPNVDISDCLMLEDIPVPNVNISTLKIKLSQMYGIWIRAYDFSSDANLFTFTNDDFTIGMLKICEMFNTDIRNYVYGLVFDKDHNLYDIKGANLYAPSISDDTYDFPDDYYGTPKFEKLRDEGEVVILHNDW